MALYRLEFLISNDVNITSGTKTVTINDSVDVSSVVPGTAVFINNQVVEALSGQNISPTQATIELRYNWPFATVTAGRLVAFNTFEGLNTAISRLNDVINSVPDFTGATSQGFLYNDGSNTYTIKPSTVFGESLLNSASASAARTLLELLPASTSEAEGGTDDAKYMTPLKTHQSFNQYGVGVSAGGIVRLDNVDLNTLKDQGSFGVVNPTNQPAGLGNGYILVTPSYSSTFSYQKYYSINQKRSYVRFEISGSYSDWSELHTDDVFNYLQNNSGSTITSGSTVAGGSLAPSQLGTWRNVSGGDVLSGSSALFKRV